MPIKSADATWLPKSVVCLSYYDPFRFRSDLMAALVLALQIFPVSIAIATTSGLPAHYGVTCAASAAFLASALGDSKIRVSAPNTMFVAVASSIVGREGLLGLCLATLLAGVLLIFFGAARLGPAIEMIPRPVVVGFSTGIAVLIVIQQLSNVVHVSAQVRTAGQLHVGAITLARQGMDIEQYAIIFVIVTLVLMIGSKRVFRHVPGGLIAITMGALVVEFYRLPVRTIDAYHHGANLISSQLSGIGGVSPDLFGRILAHAFAIAVLVAIESLQAMRLATSLTGEHFNPNGELFVHGGLNIVSALVGGLPASGVSSFTSISARVGTQTPMTGILQALFLLVFLLPMVPLVPFIPLPVISAIILLSVCGMTHWREIPQLLKLPRAEVAACLAISFLTIFTDLSVSIAAGMLIAMFLYMRKPRGPVLANPLERKLPDTT